VGLVEGEFRGFSLADEGVPPGGISALQIVAIAMA